MYWNEIYQLPWQILMRIQTILMLLLNTFRATSYKIFPMISNWILPNDTDKYLRTVDLNFESYKVPNRLGNNGTFQE